MVNSRIQAACKTVDRCVYVRHLTVLPCLILSRNTHEISLDSDHGALLKDTQLTSSSERRDADYEMCQVDSEPAVDQIEGRYCMPGINEKYYGGIESPIDGWNREKTVFYDW